MPVTDPIADLLTRMRNAIKANKRRVELPSSNMKVRIAEILKENHYINDYQVVEDNKQNVLRVFLKYSNGQSAINGLERISTPGLRSYSPVDKLPRVLNGMGITIISTSKGVMTEKQAKRDNLGGEVICQIW
ncbi:MAG: 30S ribosomal protein S8 [Ignavibacteriaceae bacterium]|nr:30S ribosomal protein S8 [Ignavibacteriaceae bacterium]NUM69804.1 30S ribosomal protein S8 [Ignavibacteriaceae bacterium]